MKKKIGVKHCYKKWDLGPRLQENSNLDQTCSKKERSKKENHKREKQNPYLGLSGPHLIKRFRNGLWLCLLLRLARGANEELLTDGNFQSL